MPSILSSIELLPLDCAEKNLYPFNLPWISDFKKLIFNSQVTFFVGENGKGKSTLMEALAVNLGFNAEGGSKNFIFSTTATHSCLHKYLRLAKIKPVLGSSFFYRSESFYNFASEIDRLDSEPAGSPFVRDSYGGKSLHTQSRGESILSLIMNRFNATGLYLLDEPEAGLSLTSQMAIGMRISELAAKGAQFLIATHSPFLISIPNSEVFSFDEQEISVIEYKKTMQYILAKRMLSDFQFS
jgi:predicted ATPase